MFASLPVWEQKGAAAYKPGLERIEAFLDAIGNPHNRLTTIHVAGTNGKGSTSHMLAAVLQSAGYRVGLFTSPHLVDFRERIRVDGDMIPESAVVWFAARWHDEMVVLGLTFFEMATAMALWWFAGGEGFGEDSDSGGVCGFDSDSDSDSDSGRGCDVAIIEAGLGGRLDSTNIIVPALSIITNIGLEHTQYLGDTRTKIAAEKAGIIKPGVPVVIGETDPESAPVFRASAAAVDSPIVFADKNAPADRNIPADSFQLDLGGDYQQKNVRTVLVAVDVLRSTGFVISGTALRAGLENAAALTGLKGRWQVVGNEPLVVLDTAHNAHGLSEIVRQIANRMESRPGGELHMVLGFAGDKDLDSILPLLPADARYILTRADNSRSMPVEKLMSRFAAFPSKEAAECVAAAIALARESAGSQDMIYIGGSNYVVGEALALLTTPSRH
jgi:dihydrofolate synthase/folylpolyglutamate synthase